MTFFPSEFKGCCADALLQMKCFCGYSGVLALKFRDSIFQDHLTMAAAFCCVLNNLGM